MPTASVPAEPLDSQPGSVQVWTAGASCDPALAPGATQGVIWTASRLADPGPDGDEPPSEDPSRSTGPSWPIAWLPARGRRCGRADGATGGFAVSALAASDRCAEIADATELARLAGATLPDADEVSAVPAAPLPGDAPTTGSTGSDAAWRGAGSGIAGADELAGPLSDASDSVASDCGAADREPFVRRWIVVRNGAAPAVGLTLVASPAPAACEAEAPARVPGTAGSGRFAASREMPSPGACRPSAGTAVDGAAGRGRPRPARRSALVELWAWLAPASGWAAGEGPVDGAEPDGDGAAPGDAAWDVWTCVRRPATGRSPWFGLVEGGSDLVSGRSGGRTVAAGVTTPSWRAGGSTWTASAETADEPEAPEDGRAVSSNTAGSLEDSARRWTRGGTRDELDVSDETAWTGAATRPAGATGVTSWPSGSTIGGSGWTPGTASRKVSDDATSGVLPTARWIGGRDAQAPVDDGRAGAGYEAGATGPGRSGVVSAGAAVERPNGHGRRTFTSPQKSAC